MIGGIGIIGAGRIGSLHAAHVAAHPRLRLVAIHDAVPRRARELADRHGCRAMDAEEFFADGEIEAVVLASSTDTHSTMGLAAAEAGKAIYWEKPIHIELDEAQRTADAVRQFGVPVMVGFNRRFDARYRTLRAAIERHDLGEVQILQITSRGPKDAPPADYIRSSGGIYRDKTIHFFDLMRFLLGQDAEEISVMAATLGDRYIAELGDSDTCVINIRLADGALCQIDNTRRAAYGFDERVEAFGDLGLIEVERTRPGLAHAAAHGHLGGSFPESFLDRFGTAFAAAMDGFARMLLDGESDVPTLEDGLQAQRLAEAAAIAARERRTVRLAEIRHGTRH